MLVNGIEHFFTKLVLFNAVPKIENSGFVEKTFAQAQVHEAPHGFNLTKIIFHLGGAEVIYQLLDVNPQLGFKRAWWLTRADFLITFAQLLF